MASLSGGECPINSGDCGKRIFEVIEGCWERGYISKTVPTDTVHRL